MTESYLGNVSAGPFLVHSNCLPQDNFIIILQDNHEIFETILFLSCLTLMEKSLS